MKYLRFLVAVLILVSTPLAFGALYTRYNVDGSICVVTEQSEDYLGVAPHYGATLLELQEISNHTAAYCPIAQRTLLEYGNFEYVSVYLKLTGTDTNDVVEGCLIAHDYDGAGCTDCDCDTYTQQTTADFVGAQDEFHLNYVGADPEGTCDVEAASGWVTQVRVQYLSRFSTTDGAITIKRIRAVGAVPGWL